MHDMNYAPSGRMPLYTFAVKSYQEAHSHSRGPAGAVCTRRILWKTVSQPTLVEAHRAMRKLDDSLGSGEFRPHIDDLSESAVGPQCLFVYERAPHQHKAWSPPRTTCPASNAKPPLWRVARICRGAQGLIHLDVQ